jgi:hypothetical protein
MVLYTKLILPSTFYVQHFQVCLVAIAALSHYKPQKNPMVYSVAMVSYMCTSLKYLMATFDIAKVDAPGRIDAESMKVLGYVMIAMDLIVIVGACAVVLTTFVVFKRKLLKAAKENGNESEKDKQGLVRVQPVQSSLTRRLTFTQIQKAVDDDKICKFEILHEKQHKASLDAIRARKKVAQTRVRTRLIERRKSKKAQKDIAKDVRSWKTAPDIGKNDDATVSAEVEKIRMAILRKVTTMKKLNRLFVKKGYNKGMMSKKEFVTLVEAVLKKKMKKTMVDFVWNAVWEERKHGENDEMDTSTMGHWLRLD